MTYIARAASHSRAQVSSASPWACHHIRFVSRHSRVDSGLRENAFYIVQSGRCQASSSTPVTTLAMAGHPERGPVSDCRHPMPHANTVVPAVRASQSMHTLHPHTLRPHSSGAHRLPHAFGLERAELTAGAYGRSSAVLMCPTGSHACSPARPALSQCRRTVHSTQPTLRASMRACELACELRLAPAHKLLPCRTRAMHAPPPHCCRHAQTLQRPSVTRACVIRLYLTTA